MGTTSEERRDTIQADLADRLAPGETMVLNCVTVPVAGARGARLPVGLGRLGAALGEALARRQAVTGGAGGIARKVPADGRAHVLVLTDRRLLLFAHGDARPRPLNFHAKREDVVRVQRRPRLQLLAKLRLHFRDESTAELMVLSGRIVKRLQAELGA